MILKIVQTGDDTLRKTAKSLSLAQLKSSATQQLIDLMIATLRDRPGVGLAAPQVGESLQIIIIEDKKEYHKRVPEEMLQAQSRKTVPLKVIVNPIITIDTESDVQYFFEGCLSVDGYAAVVPRAHTVHVTGLDRQGRAVSFTVNGWLSRIIQHEVDHLNGGLYIDTMLPRTMMTDKHYAAKWLPTSPDKLAKYVEKSRSK